MHVLWATPRQLSHRNRLKTLPLWLQRLQLLQLSAEDGPRLVFVVYVSFLGAGWTHENEIDKHDAYVLYTYISICQVFSNSSDLRPGSRKLHVVRINKRCRSSVCRRIKRGGYRRESMLYRFLVNLADVSGIYVLFSALIHPTCCKSFPCLKGHEHHPSR